MQPHGCMLLTSFQLVRPRSEAPQDEILSWVVDMHTRAAAAAEKTPGGFDSGAFHDRLRRLARHVCCGSDRIATRGYSVPEWLSASGTAARTDWFADEVQATFERMYADEPEPPDDLVHVTCTGYVSPSGAQRLVSSRGWGSRTSVTHAYHMGCYAAVPALRIALGCSCTANRRDRGYRVDVVHTELCTLHFDPSIHTAEQLVVQSLFADGSVRYSLREDDGATRGLEVLVLREMLVDGTDDAMQWRPGDHGMRMTLSRDVPEQIARGIRPFVANLFERAGLDLANERRRAVFAVHPGGPRIIDLVRDALELDESQIAASRRVLRRFGNMSSATLPHIWSDVIEDDACSRGSLVASFAFGPGLTICGSLFRKV